MKERASNRACFSEFFSHNAPITASIHALEATIQPENSMDWFITHFKKNPNYPCPLETDKYSCIIS